MASSKISYSRNQAREQMIDAVGDDKVSLELSDGTSISWQHPMFVTGDRRKAIRDLDDDDVIGMAKAYLDKASWELLVLDCDGDEDDAADEFINTNTAAIRAAQGKLQPGRRSRS